MHAPAHGASDRVIEIVAVELVDARADRPGGDERIGASVDACFGR